VCVGVVLEGLEEVEDPSGPVAGVFGPEEGGGVVEAVHDHQAGDRFDEG